MKDKFKRIIATGLLAVMISSFTACDEMDSFIDNNAITDTNGNIVGVNPDNIIPPEKTSPYTDLEGSVWEEAVSKGALIGNYIDSNEILYQGIPLQFLEQEGLVKMREDGRYIIPNGKQPDNTYNPFQYRAYIDPNSKENDIYLLIQYASNYINEKDTWLATYMLEYELDDENYQTFIKLDGDRTIKDFIQAMDNQFEPRLVFKSVVSKDIVGKGSYLNNEQGAKKLFPNIFIAHVDENKKMITYGAASPEGFRYYTLDPRQTKSWKLAQEKDGLNEEQCEEAIYMPTIDTPLGKCVAKFQVNGWAVGYTIEQSKELYDSSTHIQELEEIDINSQEKTLASSK